MSNQFCWFTISKMVFRFFRTMSRLALTMRPKLSSFRVRNGSVGYSIFGTEIYSQNLTTLAPPSQLPIPLPDGFGTATLTGIVGSESRLYLSYVNPYGVGQLFTYDLTASPPALLNATKITVTIAFAPTLQWFGSLLLCGTNVYALDGAGVPQLLSQVPLWTIFDTDASRHRVMGWAGIDGLRVVDLTNPHSPQASAATPFLAFEPPSMALAPGDTFMAANNGELETYSVTWKGGPEYLSSFGGLGINSDQKSRGNLVFLAETLGDVQGGTFDPKIFKIFDVANNNPRLIGDYEDPTQNANAVQLIGNYALLSCDNDLVVLNIANPAAPTKVTSLPVAGLALTLSGSRAILGSIENNTPTLVTIDVSNPAAPTILGKTQLDNPAYEFALNGNILAVSAGLGGVYLYDVSNPVAPVKLWNSTNGMAAWQAAWSGSLLYVASDFEGLTIWDATNPGSPVMIGSNGLVNYQSPYVPLALTVYVSGNVAWVGTDNSYATVFGLDVRDPTNPRVIHLMRYGNAVGDQPVTTIGTVGSDLLIGGNFQTSASMNLISANPPGNVIRPIPPQTSASDFDPPLQLPPIQPDSTAKPGSSQVKRKTSSFIQYKQRHVPERFRSKELKNPGLE